MSRASAVAKVFVRASEGIFGAFEVAASSLETSSEKQAVVARKVRGVVALRKVAAAARSPPMGELLDSLGASGQNSVIEELWVSKELGQIAIFEVLVAEAFHQIALKAPAKPTMV